VDKLNTKSYPQILFHCLSLTYILFKCFKEKSRSKDSAFKKDLLHLLQINPTFAEDIFLLSFIHIPKRTPYRQMTLQEIHKIAQQGEGQRLEFKKKAAFPDKIVREIVALANTEGGYLLIGVDDDGTVSGQRFIEEEVFVMEKAIRELIFPSLDYEVEIFKLNPKKGVAAFKIPHSDNRPHYLKEGEKKKAFVRSKDKSIQASKEVWEIIKRGKSPKDMVFTYGEKETVLMKSLGEKGQITLKEYQQLAKLPRFLASKTLVRLVLANVLQILPSEREDIYMLKES